MNLKNVGTGFCVWCFWPARAWGKPKRPAIRKQQDEQFVRTVATDDMTEAHLGQMAHDNAAKEPVRDFGQAVASDGRKTTNN